MDLFVVDRYMGDEVSSQNNSREEENRKLLMKHIARRKRSIEISNDINGKVRTEKNSDTDTNSHTVSSSCSSSKKKKKKSASSQLKQEDQDNTIKLLDQDENIELQEAKNPLENEDNVQLPRAQTDFTVIGGQKKKKESPKVQKTLPDWLANPHIIDTDLSSNLVAVEDLKCLSPHIQKRLNVLNIKSLFPIQKAVIPAVLNGVQEGSLLCAGGYRPSDICASAPTGSGKTLSYVIPIVQTLAKQPVCLLQALVLLPTKDLACQVKEVFEDFVKGTNLRVGLASGNRALAKEQESLVGQGYGSRSRVNILVATPGRLVDHLSLTAHFSLQHLRFLVIDEADRLLDQVYHDWLNRVLTAAYQSHPTIPDPSAGLWNDKRVPHLELQTSRELQVATTPAGFSSLQVPLQKLLFSATMTNSPEKLAPLQLYNCVLYISSKAPLNTSNADSNIDASTLSRYSVPHGLEEHMVICKSGEKPLVLLYLIKEKNLTGVLCFTSSIEATHRLFLLVNLYGGIAVAEYSSFLSAHQRHGILRDFRQGTVQLLICSDAMARGMDIDNVSYVISYDAPNYVKTYIHRIGRTARAGNKGTAYTLLHTEQVHHFKQLIQKTGREKIPKYTVKDGDLEPLIESYETALNELEEVVRNEKQIPDGGNKLKRHETIQNCLKKQLLYNIKS